MMARDTLETIRTRRSTRSYRPDPIPDDDLRAILEAARQAPSAKNLQPRQFVVVRDDAQRKAVAAACMEQHWMAQAPVIVAALGDPGASERWYAIDAAIALQTLILAAHSLGYGTCWIGAFDQAKVKAVLGVPETLVVVNLTPIGVAAEDPPPTSRRDFSRLFHLDRYGQPLEM